MCPQAKFHESFFIQPAYIQTVWGVMPFDIFTPMESYVKGKEKNVKT